MFVNICTCPCWPLISKQIFRHISGYVMGVDDDRVGEMGQQIVTCPYVQTNSDYYLAYRHVCTYPGCKNVLVFDGNMKNQWDICAAKDAVPRASRMYQDWMCVITNI